MNHRSRKNTPWRDKPETTVGFDLGDRFCHYCILQGDGEAIEQGRIPTTEKRLR